MTGVQFRVNPAAREIASCCAVLNGVGSRYHVDRYRGTLSIKAVQRGAALYSTRRSRHLVTEDSLLVLNDGQEYALDFQWPTPTETLCPFFPPQFVEEIAGCLATPAHRQLDDTSPHRRPISFCERLYSRCGRLGGVLDRLYRGLRSAERREAWLEERFRDLSEALIELNAGVRLEIESIGALKSSTREEVYRRLHRGRDYMASCFADPLSVAAVAKVAGMSPHHFHRQFKDAFQQTPMRFLQDRRLTVARRLLLTTDLPVTHVCFSVGLESLGSFSALFHRRFGVSPSKLREKISGKKQP